MANSHRAGMWVNPEHTENPPERAARATPETYQEKGVNFPYRGTETHGVPYESTIPDELEGRQFEEVAQLPPHYMPEPRKPIPVPVKIVDDSACERREWMADQFLITDGSNNAPLMVVGRHDNRHFVIIRNMDATNPVYIGPSSNVNSQNGFQIPANTTSTRFYTTEAIYAACATGQTVQISVMWEYTVSV